MKATNKQLKDYKITCRMCATTHTLLVTDVDVTNWRNGAFVQDAFPYLSADERELILSQSCGPCYDKMFPEEIEE